MSGRPANRVPVLASSGGNFPAYDGTQPWHGDPRKIDPGTAKEAAGFEPQEDVPAEYVNWLLGQLGGHLLRLDAIEAQNWGDEEEIDDPNGNFYDVAYEPNEHRYYVAGEDTATAADMQWSSDGRKNWTSLAASFSTPPVQLRSVVWFPEGQCLWTCGDLKTYAHLSGNGTTWSGYLPSGVADLWSLDYDKFAGCVWLGGTATGPDPMVRRMTSNVGAGTVLSTLASASSHNDPIRHVACGPSKRVALMKHATAAMIWGLSSADGTGTWTRRNTAPFLAMNPRCVAYSETDDLFLIPCANGKLFGSTVGDTAAWTEICDLSTLPVPAIFAGTIACRGSLWVADVSVLGYSSGLGVSRDRGATWDILGRPVTGNLERLRDVDHRFAALRGPFAGSTKIALSFRARG